MIQINHKKHSKDISRALYQTLLKLIPPKNHSPYLEDLVNALMEALSQGEIEIDINEKLPNIDYEIQGWPKEHKKALIASGWLSGENAPMVLEGSKLSWQRWHNEINEVINDLTNRATVKNKNHNIPQLYLDSAVNSVLNPRQKKAVDAIAKEKIILLSGGPGTGKTSTVMQMLENAFCITTTLKIGLAAPTGKATRRLQESLQAGIKATKPFHEKALLQIPCNTLHRWLEARPQGFGRNKKNPLNLDLFVIDEMSMVDMSLFKAVLEALPINTQIILVGDPNQLSPIGSGAIWDHLQQKDIFESFKNSRIHLTEHYRNRGEIALLSKVLCENGLYSFLIGLSELKQSANIQTHSSSINTMPAVLLERLKSHCKQLKNIADLLLISLLKDSTISDTGNIVPEKLGILLQNALEALIVLCPKRLGPWGVEHIHQSLLGDNNSEDITICPHGTPVICTENQAEFGLANGDVGIIVGEGKSLRLVFCVFSEEREISTRFIHPARLKKIQPALAMTIHKAQGSEANEVILLLPEKYKDLSPPSKSNNKKRTYEERLLYTGITRARKKVDLIFNAEG